MSKRNKDKWPLTEDPLWYKDAIIYELHIRAFCDSDGDGSGDFWGLIEKLDYLQDLGVTAIWILPFYPSPLRDDGYDISDYTNILTTYGNMHDFRNFVQEAHHRDMRVITELVVNHTSDQHPWFQRARRAQPSSRWRDFYVWSDGTKQYRDCRVIFQDFESSNWAWDPIAKQYYWHRFYSHQPDLNYDNPLVRQAIFKVMDFWLKQGVDGLRLDAIPYIYEREGTSCENLPETHAFVKELRSHIDGKFRDRMLLAEANQWPEDAVAYFGNGDECHMAFHFPLMPRMFMAIRMEDRFPIVDILRQTPSIPETAQWAIFLRNHDELTLEMVTDEERDYMYRSYARDSQARINLGIRRRLAPLLNNDRKKIELMNGLLFSLPGTPVIYYGDEIGMGDNFYLGDRNGVRTPMQWGPDRNAGFSRANPQRLYLPVIIDPEYHYEAINVEAQQNNSDSLLWWMKHIIALRKRFKAFGRGSLEFLYPENRKVLAFLRSYEDETILVIANLSRAAQQTSIDLAQLKGRSPIECFGGTEFFPITDERYNITLGPYAFYWFYMRPECIELESSSTKHKETVIALSTINDLFNRDNRGVLKETLLKYIKTCRWFRGKARSLQSSEIRDVIPLNLNDSTSYIVLLELSYTNGEPETYAIPLALASSDKKDRIIQDHTHAVVALFKTPNNRDNDMLLFDSLVDKDTCNGLLNAIGRHRRFKGEVGEVSAMPTRFFRELRGPINTGLESSPIKAEQSNTSVVFGDRLVLKLFRKLEEGINPDLEIGLFLTEKTSFPNIAPIAGMIGYRNHKASQPMYLASLQGFVVNEGDAWEYTLKLLGLYFQDVLAHPTVQVPPVSHKSLIYLDEVPSLAQETIGPYLESARLLGQRTAELHLALASRNEEKDFAPEPFSAIYQRSIYHSMRSLTSQSIQLLRQRLKSIPEDCRQDAQSIIDQEEFIIKHFQAIVNRRISAVRTRIHGDYHLGQVLHTGKDFIIIDFEGEPARSLGERRIKRCPLKDVAGMIRSFHYAVHTALMQQESAPLRPEDIPVLEQWGQLWYVWVSVTFLTSYRSIIEQAKIIPADKDELRLLLDVYLMEKSVYEVAYELNNRPNWIKVPLKGILYLLETTA
ncbi:MAG: maltose alpha-D-glucosyltransferase [Chloroflexota bacterium]|nr:maltose alpha-D-glucosyltransferase [Chloroflexota bacterium]